MQLGKPIMLRGQPLGGEKFPAVCTPLVGRSSREVLSEVQLLVALKPDLLEWRVDFFEGIGNPGAVLDLAARIRQAAAGIPLLFTRRCVREGGARIDLTEEQVVALYGAVCRSGQVDFVDFEMGNDPAHVRQVRAMSKAGHVGLILSFHDFHSTPPIELLNQRFLQAQEFGADVAKVAVMPGAMEDVLTLLSATLQSSQKLDIPLISMSMGAYGSLTRLFGWAFGSALTFAIGAGQSAPGQLPISDLNAVQAILQRSLR